MATNKTLSDFKTALSGGGARPNLFEVAISSPSGSSNLFNLDDNFTVLCKAAALPASNVGNIDVPFRGRVFKVAGDRTFDSWQITVINDENFKYRTIFEKWMQHIAQYSDASGASNPNNYMAEASVTQLKRSTSTLTSNSGSDIAAGKQYKFHDIFPTNISAIDLSYDSSDQIEEFTVEFQVNHWEPASY
jgi:hypothetical protein